MPSPFSAYNLIQQGTKIFQIQNGDAVTFISPTAPLQTGTPSADYMANPVNIPLLVWLSGILLLTMYFTITYVLFRREFQMALPVKNEYVDNWLAQLKIKRTITIRQSSRIFAPLTYGIRKPVILMPKHTNWENTKQTDYVLAHELVHIRRFDTVTKLLLTAVLCIHWFNPLVWVMYILSNRDMELSCDETVVHSFGDTTKSAYARTLISMEERKNRFTPLCNSFSKNAIEERITAIMKMKKTSVVTLSAAVLLIGGVTIVFATSARAENDNIPQANTTESVITQQEQAEHDNHTQSIKAAAQSTIGAYEQGDPNADAAEQMEMLAQYGEFGVSFNSSGDMLYNGELVRYFCDGVEVEAGAWAMINFKAHHLLHDKKQYPVKTDYYHSCHNPFHHDCNQNCHGNHKNKRYIATDTVPQKLFYIGNMKYRKESILIALYILIATRKSERYHFYKKV